VGYSPAEVLAGVAGAEISARVWMLSGRERVRSKKE